MNKLTWRLLEGLADGRRHTKLPKGVGPKTADLCIQRLEWVQMKQVTVVRKVGLEVYFLFSLTPHGRIVYLNEYSRRTGRIPRELKEHRLQALREMLGSQIVRSLQKRTAVFKVWRRSSPHNRWVENRRGEQLWHSDDDNLGPGLLFFEPVEHSQHIVGTGIPFYTGSDRNSPEESTYRLKKAYC